MLTATRKNKKRKRERIKEISEEIREISDAGFNEVNDADLLEAIIYERSALRARYSFLLKELRRIQES